MEHPEEELKKSVSRWQTAYFLSMAILDDYAQTIAKIEGTTPQQVKDRIKVDVDKRVAEFKKTLPPPNELKEEK